METTTEMKLAGFLYKMYFIFIVIYFFFFFVQENAYGRPNLLEPISVLLSHQMTATSLFGGAAYMFLAGSMSIWISSVAFYRLEDKQKWIKLICIVAAFILGIINTIHEYYQYLAPRYPDAFALDTAAGWIAFIFVAICVYKHK